MIHDMFKWPMTAGAACDRAHWMRRRDFLKIAAGACAAWPVGIPNTLEAQPAIRRIGVLVLGNPDPAPFMEELRDGLLKQGYLEDRDIRLELRSAGGNAAALPAAAADLVKRQVDIIVAWQTPSATAAKQATSEIPIVMTAGDPVGTGLITSLSRPGGNVTGVDSFGAQLGGKCVELIRDVIASPRRVAVLANSTDPFTKSFLAEINRVAASLHIATQPLMRRPNDNFESAFREMRQATADAVIVQPTLLAPAVVDLALKYRMPSCSISRGLPASGGLMAYTQNVAEQTQELARYVSRILKGAKPADMPIWQPTKFELILNLKTAKAIGLEIPATLLARADEVIE